MSIWEIFQEVQLEEGRYKQRNMWKSATCTRSFPGTKYENVVIT